MCAYTLHFSFREKINATLKKMLALILYPSYEDDPDGVQNINSLFLTTHLTLPSLSFGCFSLFKDDMSSFPPRFSKIQSSLLNLAQVFSGFCHLYLAMLLFELIENVFLLQNTIQVVFFQYLLLSMLPVHYKDKY
jgi:hypothetical protein